MLLHYQQKPTISEQIIHENTTCEIVSGVQKISLFWNSDLFLNFQTRLTKIWKIKNEAACVSQLLTHLELSSFSAATAQIDVSNQPCYIK